MISKQRLTTELREKAAQSGFALCGVCPAVSPQGMAPLVRWLEAGFAGEMAYIRARQNAYSHPDSILSGVRSLVMLGMSYYAGENELPKAGQGRVARYAASPLDYHDHIHAQLKKLKQHATELRPEVKVRGVVDTAPLLEREFAQLAGLGWVGKNTMLLSRKHGSWFFLAALLLDCELEYDLPTSKGHCGTCTACLDACPTQAFPEPYVLDATKCISYLTIELKNAVPMALRTSIGDWLFGCDICQDVCPWNHMVRKQPPSTTFPTQETNSLDLHQLFELSDESFRQRFRKTAFWRSRRRGLLRNAAIVLGNEGSPDSQSTLASALRDPEPLVRSAAAWALGQIATPEAVETLKNHLAIEQDTEVRAEIDVWCT